MSRGADPGKGRITWRRLAAVLLLAAVVLEAYYIVTLRAAVGRQTEEMRSISMELQALKTEHAALREELSSASRQPSEEEHGHSAER